MYYCKPFYNDITLSCRTLTLQGGFPAWCYVTHLPGLPSMASSGGPGSWGRRTRLHPAPQNGWRPAPYWWCQTHSARWRWGWIHCQLVKTKTKLVATVSRKHPGVTCTMKSCNTLVWYPDCCYPFIFIYLSSWMNTNSLNPNSLRQQKQLLDFEGFYCSVTMLRELGLIAYHLILMQNGCIYRHFTKSLAGFDIRDLKGQYRHDLFNFCIYLLFNLGRPFSETLFFKGTQETHKQGRLLCEPETPG